MFRKLSYRRYEKDPKWTSRDEKCNVWGEKNALGRIIDNLDIAEEKISKLKDTTVEIIINKTQKKMNSISDQWDYFKHPDIHVIRVLKEGQRQKYS